MTVTATAIRTAVLAELDLDSSVLTAHGPSRPPATDLARACVLKVIDDEGVLSRREAAFFVGFRSAGSAEVLLARLDAGEFDDHPDIPSKYEGDPTALITSTKVALEPSP